MDPLSIDQARRIVREKGADVAQQLFRESFDPAIGRAISEELERRVDTFNKLQREVMYTLPFKNLPSFLSEHYDVS